MGGSAMMAKGGCAAFYKIGGNVVRENILAHKTSISSIVRDKAAFWKIKGSSFGNFEYITSFVYQTMVYLDSSDTKAYFFKSATNRKIIIYDFATHTWDDSSGSTLSLVVTLPAYYYSGKIYMMAYNSPYRIIWYDIATNTFDTSSGAVRPNQFTQTGFGANYGSKLIALDTTAFHKQYRLYDTVTNSWSTTGDPMVDVSGSLYNPFVIGDKLFVTWYASYYPDINGVKKQPIYDFISGTWNYSATVPNYNGLVPISRCDNKVYYLAITSGSYPAWTFVVIAYDISTDTWITEGFSSPPLTTNVNAIYASRDPEGIFYLPATFNKYIYDPVNDVWDSRDIIDPAYYYYIGSTQNGRLIFITDIDAFQTYFGGSDTSNRINI